MPCSTTIRGIKLSLAKDEIKYREPQPDITKRVRDFGILSHKWMSPSNPSPRNSGKPTEKEAERV